MVTSGHGPADRGDSKAAKSHDVHDKAAQQHEQAGNKLRPTKHDMELGTESIKKQEQFAANTAISKPESRVAELTKATHTVANLDWSRGNQKQITEAINDIPKAVEAAKALTKGPAVDKFVAALDGAIKGTSQRIESVTQKHADVVASLPAAERQQYEDRVKQLSRNNVV